MIDINTSCSDWEERIVAGKSLIAFDPPFPDEAERALRIFKSLRLTDVIGQPTLGEACGEWVFEFVAAIFGSYDSAEKEQLISKFLLLIPKKNAKSTIAAGIMLTALILNERYGAEALILAPTREVADNSYKPASAMVRASPELSKLIKPQDSIRTLTNLRTGATLKVISADSNSVAGAKASFVLVDELWLFGKRSGADAMLGEATGGLVSRPEGFVIALTTQSDEPPAGVFKEWLDRFRDIRDGKIIDPRSLGVLYEFPQRMIDDKSAFDVRNWGIVNPNMGRSIKPEQLARMAAEEQGKDAGTRNKFIAKHANIEIGMGLRSNRWPGASHWPSGSDEELAGLPHWDAL